MAGGGLPRAGLSGRERFGCSRSWEGCGSLLGNQVTPRARGPDHAQIIAGGDRPRPGARDASGGCRELHPGAGPSSVPDRPTRWLRGAGDAAFLSRST